MSRSWAFVIVFAAWTAIYLPGLGSLEIKGEKGRLIEIEAIYVSLCGLAIICWLSWWQQRRSPCLTWTVPWIFLALGLLAKGPLLLIFFYAVIVAVLWRGREMHLLLGGPHFA